MCAEDLDDLVTVLVGTASATRYEHTDGKLPEWTKFELRTWGEVGVVKVKTKTSNKLLDKGVPCMMCGYAMKHPGDCYRMYNPETKGVHESRDVTWLRRMFYDPPARVREISHDGVELDIDVMEENVVPEPNQEPVQPEADQVEETEDGVTPSEETAGNTDNENVANPKVAEANVTGTDIPTLT